MKTSRFFMYSFFLLTSVLSVGVSASEPIDTAKSSLEQIVEHTSLFAYFESRPAGSLIQPFLERISTTGESAQDLHNIRVLLIPAIVAGNQHTIAKLEKDIVRLTKEGNTKGVESRKIALDFAKRLDDMAKSWADKSLTAMAEEATEFLTLIKDTELSAQWIAANRLAGFTNSLSTHVTSHGVDLQAATKMAPNGIMLLYGQNQATDHHGKKVNLYEMHRHLGANNELVKYASWGNIFATGLKVPAHYGAESFKAGNYTQALKDIYAHSDEFGALKLYDDGKNEVTEALRGLFWVSMLVSHKEMTLAKDATIKWIGELGPASRRLRKFIQLNPHGNLYLFTFQNSIAVPMFVLDFKEGYLGVLWEQWESLQQKEPWTGDYYAEALNMALTSVTPFMAALHLYIFGFGKNLRDGMEGCYAHLLYNFFQYITYGLIQSYFHINMFSGWVASHFTAEAGARAIAHVTAALLTTIGAIKVYDGGFGDGPRAFAQTYIPMGVKILLADNVISNIVGAAIGDKHFNAISWAGNSAWNAVFGAQTRDDL